MRSGFRLPLPSGEGWGEGDEAHCEMGMLHPSPSVADATPTSPQGEVIRVGGRWRRSVHRLVMPGLVLGIQGPQAQARVALDPRDKRGVTCLCFVQSRRTRREPVMPGLVPGIQGPKA
jgi:hypothetical protein